jgi:hypothetical protein
LDLSIRFKNLRALKKLACRPVFQLLL